MDSTGNCPNSSETTEKITINRDEYSRLQALVKQQQSEIAALEYRIKTILS